MLTFALLAGASQAALFSPAVFYEDLTFKFGGETHRRIGEIIFGSLHRIVFVSLYAACCLFLHSHPDFWLSKLLSHKALVVLSRFSYSAFMAHPLVIMFMLSSMPDMNMNSTFLQMMCLYTIVVSLFVGYLFFIFFEAPAMNLLKSWATGSKIRSISMIEEKSQPAAHEASNNNYHQKQQ
jgi:peptidoglycan/LPS O-acetylase OafA/YrhL